MSKLLLIFITTFSFVIFHGCQRDIPPKEKAFELVKESNILNNDLPVKRVIEEWLDKKKNEVKPIGWKVTKKDDKVYLVSYHYKIYSFNEGTGERVFSFEVNIDTEIVKDVTRESEQRMMPLSKPFQDENEISEELLKKFDEEEVVQ